MKARKASIKTTRCTGPAMLKDGAIWYEKFYEDDGTWFDNRYAVRDGVTRRTTVAEGCAEWEANIIASLMTRRGR